MSFARVAALSLLLVGCNRVDLKYAEIIDAGDVSCSEVPRITCDAIPKAEDSCTGTGIINGSIEASLPTDASFPGGCQVYFRGKDCSSRGYCTCDFIPDSGVQAVWNCHDADGGG